MSVREYAVVAFHLVALMLLWPVLGILFRVVRLFCVFFWRRPKKSRDAAISYFHPFALSGGGGERVLWQAVRGHLEFSDSNLVIYSSQIPESLDHLSRKIGSSFGIHLDPSVLHRRLAFVHLPFSACLDPQSFPVATMFFQLFGAVCVAFHAVLRDPFVQVFIDSTGWAPTLMFAKVLTGCRTGAYVHYPTISDVHLDAATGFLRKLYLGALFLFYRFCGSFVDFAAANSSWTMARMKKIWPSTAISLVYPPCPVEALSAIATTSKRERIILSIGQFRPEKNHALQLQAFAEAVANGLHQARLVVIGSTRSPGDEDRVVSLQTLARDLGIYPSQVEFLVNVPFATIKEFLGRALVGVHTMQDEHFGISVVEFMAAGVIPVAHQSGGPLDDIVLDNGENGLLAKNAHEFAHAFVKLLEQMSPSEVSKMRERSQRRAQMFSSREFEEQWIGLLVHNNVFPRKKEH
eukprot:ANDGO_05597.mRNA.1 GDP-Man:Man(3)GlcNAc(2)-PP-Dol alpha-1